MRVPVNEKSIPASMRAERKTWQLPRNWRRNTPERVIATQHVKYYTSAMDVKLNVNIRRLSPPPPPLVDSAQGSNALGFFSAAV
jgi:hypothetical protein